MDCPNCKKSKIRRSPRRGLYEGLVLRLGHKAPYRCEFCRLRFVGATDPHAVGAAQRPRSLLKYLGLVDTLTLHTFISLGLAGVLLALILVGIGLTLFHEPTTLNSGL